MIVNYNWAKVYRYVKMKVKVGTDGQADDGMKWFRRSEGVSVCTEFVPDSTTLAAGLQH